MDDLGFVKAIDGFGECVVVGVADAADGRFDARFEKAFGVFDRDILASPVRVMNEAAALAWPSRMQRLFKRIEDEAGMRRAARLPADDAARGR